MAISKHPFGRYHIIDRELRRHDFVKTKEFKEIIEDELSINVSEKMINEDIIAMRDDSLLGYYAPIAYNNSKKAYYYTDREYTIKAFRLNQNDINAIMFYAKAINQYKEYEVFEDFSNAIEKILDAVRFMDSNECKTMINAARSSWGKAPSSILSDFNKASSEFDKVTKNKFGKKGEW